MADYDPDAPIPHFDFPDNVLQEVPEIAHPWAESEYDSPLAFFNGKSFKDGLKDFTEFQEQHGSAVGDAQPGAHRAVLLQRQALSRGIEGL